MRITRSIDGNYTLDWCRYTKSVIKKLLGISGARFTKQPLPSEWEASKQHESKNKQEAKKLAEQFRMEYSSVIGSLIYLLYTLPDITFAVTKFMRTSGQEHFHGLIHLLQYLQDNSDFGITFYRNIEDSSICALIRQAGEKDVKALFGTHDSSWQDCPDTGRSTGSYVLFSQGGAVDLVLLYHRLWQCRQRRRNAILVQLQLWQCHIYVCYKMK